MNEGQLLELIKLAKELEKIGEKLAGIEHQLEILNRAVIVFVFIFAIVSIS